MLSRALSKALIALVILYRGTLARFLGGQCRFQPSCSQYAIDAIHKHGPIRGGIKAAWRILRCNPFCKSGYDPA